MNNEGYIKFYNCFMENGDLKITPYDWYWHSLIAARWNPFYNVAEISISRLTEIQSYYNNKKESINKANVKEKVWLLQEKGLIKINTPNEQLVANQKGEFNYNKTLEISFSNFDGKFEMIPKSLYDRTSNIYENYALCRIYRFQKWHESNKRIKGFEKSLEAWEGQLSCGEDTVKETIENMLKNGLIVRKGWNKKQLENGQYKSTPYEYFVKEDMTTVEDIPNIQDNKPNEPELEENELELPHEKTQDSKEHIEIIWGNWRDRTVYITEDDVYLYWKQIHIEEFKKVCDKRRHDLMNPKKVGSKPFDFTTWDESAKEIIKREVKKEKEEAEKTCNAITYYDSNEKVYINASNVNNIDFEKIDKLYYLQDSSLTNGQFLKMAGADIEDRSQINDEQFKFIVDEYKKLIFSGNMADVKDLLEIRNRVVV